MVQNMSIMAPYLVMPGFQLSEMILTLALKPLNLVLQLLLLPFNICCIYHLCFACSLLRRRVNRQNSTRGSIKLVHCSLIWSRKRWSCKRGDLEVCSLKLKHKPSMDGDFVILLISPYEKHQCCLILFVTCLYLRLGNSVNDMLLLYYFFKLHLLFGWFKKFYFYSIFILISILHST